MSRPWFTHSQSDSTRRSRRTRPSYIPRHLRTQPPNITATVPPHSVRPPRVPRSDAADPFDISEKFDELEVISQEEYSSENQDHQPPATAANKVTTTFDDVQVEMEGTDVPPPANTFEEMDLALIDNIRKCKYVKPTPIQRHAIPAAMRGRDLMACAQTGSGKTAAFCFPIINGVMVDKRRNKVAFGSGVACPMALILAPTRELSCQIHEEAKKFSRRTGVKVVVVYGGSPIAQQLQNLGMGVDILVATPGRLLDMIERSKVSLMNVKYLVLDEADRMLDMGFERQVRKIVQQIDMPPPGTRQTMLFSATFPPEIKGLASDFLSNYIFLAAGKVGSSTDLIVQRVEFVPDTNKRNYLVDLLCQITNKTHAKNALTLVFVETKRAADTLERWLSRKGYPSAAIHGDKVQVERERALKSFRTGRTPILVATDVAARGLDIPHVAHVINFDLPRVVDDYVHRIGRTGRAGKSGLATAFFSEKNIPLAKPLVDLMQEANQQVPTWLTEYAKIPCISHKSRDYNYASGRAYKDRDYDRYSDQHGTDLAAYAGSPCAFTSSSRSSGPNAAPSFPYVADLYNYERNCWPVTASGWD